MVYSPEAYWSGVGFTAAQGTINAVETAMYGVYLYIVYAHGSPERRQGTGAPDKGKVGWFGETRTVYGKEAVVAVLIAYSSFLLTLSKTILYCELRPFGVGLKIRVGKLISIVYRAQ